MSIAKTLGDEEGEFNMTWNFTIPRVASVSEQSLCYSTEDRNRLKAKVRDAVTKDFSNQKSLGSMKIEEFRQALFGK